MLDKNHRRTRGARLGGQGVDALDHRIGFKRPPASFKKIVLDIDD